MTPFRLSARALAPRSVASLPVVPSASAVPPVPTAPSVAQGAGPPGAVPVPWRVTKRSLGVIEIEHRGTEEAHSVRFALFGGGMLGLSLPQTVGPGERVRVAVRGQAAEDARGASDAMLVMRWFRPDGTELLWPIALE